MSDQADSLRRELTRRWPDLLPQDGSPLRPPIFEGRNRAAERLRRRGEYRTADSALVMPDPVLLQVRINAVSDLDSLVAATPGLKQGLVRLVADALPMASRSRDLRGGSMFSAGKPMRFPEARLGQVRLMVIAGLAVDHAGLVLDDGRCLAALTLALIKRLGSWKTRSKVAVLVDDCQIIDHTPPHQGAVGADLIVTPDEVMAVDNSNPPDMALEDLPEKLAHLPVVKAVLSMHREP